MLFLENAEINVEIVPDGTSSCLDWNYLLHLPKLPTVWVSLKPEFSVISVWNPAVIRSGGKQSHPWWERVLCVFDFFFSYEGDQSFEPQTMLQLTTSFLLLEKKPCLCLPTTPARLTEATSTLHTGKVRERKCHFFHFQGAWFPRGAEFCTSKTFRAISIYRQAHIITAST